MRATGKCKIGPQSAGLGQRATNGTPWRQVRYVANSVEKLHFHRGPGNFRAVQEQLQFLTEGVAKNRLLLCGIR